MTPYAVRACARLARRAGYYLAERACAMPGDEHSEGTGAGVGEKRAGQP